MLRLTFDLNQTSVAVLLSEEVAAMWEDWATRAQVKLAANESKPKKKKKAAK
jgi:hypothetical protein